MILDWITPTFTTELEARATFKELFGEAFQIIDEVELVSLVDRQARFRIDAVAVAKSSPHYVLGVEFKRPFFKMSEFAAALKQAADYRSATVVDDRLPMLRGHQLGTVVLFPSWNGEHDEKESYKEEAFGMQLVAGQFRVGVAGQIKGGFAALMVGQHRMWTSREGWTGHAAGVLAGKRGRGAGRAAEALVLAALERPIDD